MNRANINDPSSIERLYPLDRFSQHAGENARGKATTIHGVLISSKPDGEGFFDVAEATRHVGEDHGQQNSIFVAAMRKDASGTFAQGTYGGEKEQGNAMHAPISIEEDYRSFLASVVNAAREADFAAPIGQGDERLTGFHGG